MKNRIPNSLQDVLNLAKPRSPEGNQNSFDLSNISNSRELPLRNNFIRLLLSHKDSNQPENANQEKKIISDSKLPITSKILSKKFFEASELKNKGFCLAPKLIFDSIVKGDKEVIENIISHSLYSINNIDLALWFLLEIGYLKEAEKLWLKEQEHLKKYCDESEFKKKQVADSIIMELSFMNTAFDQAINYGVDQAACKLIRKNYSLLTIDRLCIALEKGCVNLLKIVWSGDLVTEPELIRTQIPNSEFWSFISKTVNDVEEVENMKTLMKPINIFNYYLKRERSNEVRKIMTWQILSNSYKVLNSLIEFENSQLASEYILATKLKITSEQICIALDRKKYEVCYTMLKVINQSLEFIPLNLQKELISLTENPDTCLLAAEILNRLNLRSWNIESTRDLCLTLTSTLKKKQDIMYCPNPMLYAVLIAEVMRRIGNFSDQYRTRCFNTQQLYIEFGVSLQKSFKNEETLKFYMTEKDSRNRSVLQICAEKKFYQLLESDEVGIIVTKLWIGSEAFYGLHRASSIVTTVLAPAGSEESRQFTKGIDENKPYSFQLVRWRDACSSRYITFSISVLVMIILYQILLYKMIANGSILDISKGDYEAQLFGIIVTLIFGITCEQILGIIYSIKTAGKVDIDMWKIIDWVIGLLVLFISIQVPLKVYENGWVNFDSAYIGSGIAHSIMLFLLCMKFWHINMTSITFGPFLSMALMIFKEIYTFFIIYMAFALCFGAIFTLLFKATPGYGRLDLSLRTLYMATIGPFVIDKFKEDRIAFGAIMLAIFLLIAYVLLLNLLVGIVSNVFNQFQKQISSEYRSVIIKTYYENLWNDQCGILILAPTPLNAISLLFSPLVLHKNGEKWNRILTKALFSLYALPYYFLFIIISFLAIPIAYLEGFLIQGRTGVEVVEEQPIKIFNIPDDGKVNLVKKFSYSKFFFWTVKGPFWLVYAFFRDCIQFWKIAYLETSGNTKNENNNKIDQTLIKNFHKTLSEIGDRLVTVDEFYSVFQPFDIVSNEQIDNREWYCRTALDRFCSPQLDSKIDCLRIKKLFPRLTGVVYDEEYIKRFTHFNLPYIYKAITGFQRQIGSTENLRKTKMNNKGDNEVFFMEIKKVEKITEQVKEKIEALLENCEIVLGNGDKDDAEFNE